MRPTTITSNPTIQEIIAQINNEWGPCISLYVHGSSVFLEDVVTPKDIDLLAIVDDGVDDNRLKQDIQCDSSDSQFQHGPYEVTVYTKSVWFAKLAAMDLTMITCAYLPRRFVLQEFKDPKMQQMTWKDPASRLELVQSIWSYAEYTWKKARRVLDRWRDPYKSSKNVYFVFRLLELGCQLLLHDKIVDFQAANPWYFEIQKLYQNYNIQSGDFELVEAALARSYEQEIARFQELALQRNTPTLEERKDNSKGNRGKETCSICLYPCDSYKSEQSDTETVCTLLCGHTFHLHCMTEWIRRETSRKTTCPLCRQGFSTKTNRKSSVVQQELDRQGIQEREFTGYPATIVVQHRNDPNSVQVTVRCEYESRDRADGSDDDSLTRGVNEESEYQFFMDGTKPSFGGKRTLLWKGNQRSSRKQRHGKGEKRSHRQKKRWALKEAMRIEMREVDERM
uniref:RING-type domain-containing protein n=1 Tax=Amphora coffeiformis TaxID=265554 RepID=A0A7S3LB99_9STRA